MSQFYDQRAQELLGAVNDYSQNLNSITQQNLQAKISNIGGLKQLQETTTQTLAGGKESSIQDQLQEHLNKFADEMGLDVSVTGLGKPVLSYASKKAKQFAADRVKRLQAQAEERQAQAERADPENIRGTRPEQEVAPDEGTELQEFASRGGPGRGDLPTGRLPSQLEREQQAAEARGDVVQAEPIDDPVVDAPPRPQLASREPTTERSTAPTERTVEPTRPADLGRAEPIEVDALRPGLQPLEERQPNLGPDFDTINALPEEVGWKGGIATGRGDPLAGPGDFPAVELQNPVEAAYSQLNRLPAMGQNDGLPPVRPEAEDNPFRFQGSSYDDSLLTKGPPAEIPVPQNVSFQYQAPSQAEAEAARGISRAEPSGGESLIQARPIEGGKIVPEGATGGGSQEARDQLAKALGGRGRGGGAGPDDPAVPQEPPVAEPVKPLDQFYQAAEPEPVLPERFGTFQDRGGGLAPQPPPRDIPGGPEAFGGRDYQMPENPLVGRDQQPINDPGTSNEIATRSGMNEESTISDALQAESRNAVSNLTNQTAALTDEAEQAGKSLIDKATTALSEVTGSDVLGGIGSCW